MRTYKEMIDEYLNWYSEISGNTNFLPNEYLIGDEQTITFKKAQVWNKILEMSYKPVEGIYWFHKFILGDMTYAGYPEPIRFNGLWWDWTKIGAGGDHITIKCSRQHGKANPYSTPIITPSGWTTMGQLKIGDKVFSEKGIETTVTNIFEQGKKNVYKITFTDGSVAECELEHLWKVKKAGTGRNGKELNWKTKSLKEIINKQGMEPKSDNAYRIPLTKPVQFKKQKHYIDTYTLGALIGDGGLSQDSCILTTADIEIVDTIKTNMPQLMIINSGNYSYRLIDTKINHKSKLITELKRLKLWGTKSLTKFIPQEYMVDSVENRIKLLRGLMDTDGCISDTCIMEYYSISKELCKQVKELVQSLGGKARIDIKNGKYKGKKHISYRVKIWLQGINPFKLKRKANKFYNIKYKPVRIFKKIELVRRENCRCIMVDDDSHTYLINDYIVTHNSTYWTVLVPVYRMAMFEHYNVLLESASEDQAIMLMGYMTNIIVNNEFLLEKRNTKSKWSSKDIVYNGGVIRARGVGSEVRGGTYDYIVCDDILRSDNKLSDTEIENFVDEELEPMILVRKGQMVIVGTPKSETDIFTSIEERIELDDTGESWKLYTYPAIIDWENEKILCPDRFTWKQLMAIRARQGTMKFDKEFMCKTYSSGAQLFTYAVRKKATDLGCRDILYSTAKPQEANEWQYYISVDCARAGTAGADFTVVFVIAYNSKTNIRRVVWMWRKKGLKIALQVEQMAEISRNFNHPIILVEKNNMGQDFIDLMIDDYGLNVEPFTTGGRGQGKEDLIRSLIIAFENEKIILPYGNEFSREQMKILDRELERFVVEVTKAGNEVMKGSGHSHDDTVISLALANRCAQSFGYSPFAQAIPSSKTTALERFVASGDSTEILMATINKTTASKTENDFFKIKETKK